VPIVASTDFPEVGDVVTASGRAVTWFGSSVDADWRALDVEDDGRMTRFTVATRDGRRVRTACTGPGTMNVVNALGVLALTSALGVDLDAAAAAVATFAGVKRRQEVIGEVGNVVVIDDFAHHPTAVTATIGALRARYPRRRLWVLFEPRSNTTRRRVFQDAFAAAFSAADRVTFGAVHRRDQMPEPERLSTGELVATLHRNGVAAEVCEDPDAIADLVTREARPGDVVVMMSNGGFGGLAGKLSARLALDRREP
jgi:UDP-N-acetylmuramate: L-alanyl-gamma-D-glutamyl-meso-diaminopimelate ligase